MCVVRMRRDKRQARITVNSPPQLHAAIKLVAKQEDRTVSHWLLRLAERDPSIQIALQQIGGACGRQ